MRGKRYYQIAGEASLNFEANVGLRTIKEVARSSASILDVGCGEGTRLAMLESGGVKTGVDIDAYALRLARSRYKGVRVIKYDGERLPFDQGQFDLVYSAYVLEHTRHPYKFIDEMIRVTKKGGQLILITPNFGAPNRRSPNSVQTKLKKLAGGLFEDLTYPSDLRLTRVEPKKVYRVVDDDTTVEPYLRKLEGYIKDQKLRLVCSLSMWELDEGRGPAWKTLKTLGKAGIYPFAYWGPQAFVWFQK